VGIRICRPERRGRAQGGKAGNDQESGLSLYHSPWDPLWVRTRSVSCYEIQTRLSSEYLKIFRSQRIASRFFDPGPFRFSARSCNRWSDGRVVLCGDAAHVFSPCMLTLCLDAPRLQPKLTGYVQLGDRELHPVSVMQFLLHGALLYSVASNPKTPTSTRRS
jgi:hypothetical protein